MRNPLLLLLLLAAACGGGDDLAGPTHADVGGAWRIKFSNMSGTGATCNTNSADLTLTHSSATAFGGTYGPVIVTCVAGADEFSGTFQGTVVNGTVNGSSVAFDLDTPDVHQTGTVSGSSMSGSAHWIVNAPGGGTLTGSGTWSATKQ